MKLIFIGKPVPVRLIRLPPFILPDEGDICDKVIGISIPERLEVSENPYPFWYIIGIYDPASN